MVIASPGGHPKDINVYQAQKAVSSAARIVRPGGTIILAAACPEGSGSPHYERWVSGKHSREEVIEAFRTEGFRIGPHKAFQLARDTEHTRSGRLFRHARPAGEPSVAGTRARLPDGGRCGPG